MKIRTSSEGQVLGRLTATLAGVLLVVPGPAAHAAQPVDPSGTGEAAAGGSITPARLRALLDGGIGSAESKLLVQACFETANNRGAIAPHLTEACMLAGSDDPKTKADESEELWVIGEADGPTGPADPVVVRLDANGDTTADVVAPAPPMPEEVGLYAGPIWRVVGGKQVKVKDVAIWLRVSGKAPDEASGYAAILPWRKLGLTKARFQIALESGAGFSRVPGAFAGALYTLPVAVPASAPRAVSAVAGDHRVTVSWKAPARQGTSPITNYRVVASPSGRTCVARKPTCTVTGLANNRAYRFRVQAISNAGAGPWSASSPAAVPRPAPVVSVSARSQASKLRVQIAPVRSTPWRFVVETRSADTWRAVVAYQTTSAGTRTINLPAGTYRVRVPAQAGYSQVISTSVVLRK